MPASSYHCPQNMPVAIETPFTIAAIDDEELFLSSLARILRREPYRLIGISNPHQALSLLESESVQLVLLDLQMPGRDGMALLSDIVSLYPDIPVIMLTGHGSINQAVQAIQAGAADFLEKPCDAERLRRRLAAFHNLWRQRHANPRPKDFHFPDLAGDSTAMTRLRSLILRVAASDAPVLIQGESGSGKELVARAIHRHSDRAQQVFGAVDCAAINDSVLESELFGYEKGAFTGADKAGLGLIRAADKGTLFLDEVGEIPLKMQAKLLRTLQEQEVRPVGSTRSQSVDIRVIAATNRTLEEEISAGRFRSDLYYRIAAITLTVPPLRERVGDIALLARHIIKRLGKNIEKEISAPALRLLQQYTWPGNVRELENVLRRALALSEGTVLGPDDLPATLVLSSPPSAITSPADDSLAAYERLALMQALKKTVNNKRQAAALLGIGEATLYRKMKEYHLSE